MQQVPGPVELAAGEKEGKSMRRKMFFFERDSCMSMVILPSIA